MSCLITVDIEALSTGRVASPRHSLMVPIIDILPACWHVVDMPPSLYLMLSCIDTTYATAGAIYAYESEVEISERNRFANNMASDSGGTDKDGNTCA